MSSDTSNYTEITRIDGKIFIRYLPPNYTYNEGEMTGAITSQRGLIATFVSQNNNSSRKKK